MVSTFAYFSSALLEASTGSAMFPANARHGSSGETEALPSHQPDPLRAARSHPRRARGAPAAPVREPFVGGVAKEGVTEAEGARGVGSRSTNSPSRPHASESDAAVGSSASTSAITARSERRPEHSRPAQERAVARSEPVDARRDKRLDGLRQLLSGLAAPPREPRAPAGRAGCRAALSAIARQPRPKALGRPPRAESATRLVLERLELDRHRGDRRHALGPEEAALDRPTSRAYEPRAGSAAGRPRWRRSSVEASSIQWTSSITTRVGQSSSPRARLDDAVQPGAPERGLELVDLRVGSTWTSSGAPSAEPRHELRVELPHALASAPGRAAVLRQVEQDAEEGPEGEVRRRGLVLGAPVSRRQVGACACSSSTRRDLPIPGSPISSTSAEAHPHRRDRAREDRPLALAADEREPASARPRPCRQTASTRA